MLGIWYCTNQSLQNKPQFESCRGFSTKQVAGKSAEVKAVFYKVTLIKDFCAGIFAFWQGSWAFFEGVYKEVHDREKNEADAAKNKKTKQKRACSSGG